MIDGLMKAYEIIEREIEIAKRVNPLMAMGMSQILMLLDKEIVNVERGGN